MKEQFLEWLRKTARYLKTAGAALSKLAAMIETLIAIIGPDFGFGTA